MEHMLCSVFDSAAKRYLQVFAAPTIEVAIREFRRIVNQPGHQFAQFPEDYTLFLVGSFDQETGALNALPAPQSLGVAVQFIDQTPKLEVATNE